MAFGHSSLAPPWVFSSPNGHLFPNRGMSDTTITGIDALEVVKRQPARGLNDSK